jgi:hypothetical protein
MLLNDTECDDCIPEDRTAKRIFIEIFSSNKENTVFIHHTAVDCKLRRCVHGCSIGDVKDCIAMTQQEILVAGLPMDQVHKVQRFFEPARVGMDHRLVYYINVDKDIPYRK